MSERGSNGPIDGGSHDESWASDDGLLDGYDPQIAIAVATRSRASSMLADVEDRVRYLTAQNSDAIGAAALSAMKLAATWTRDLRQLQESISLLAGTVLQSREDGASNDAAADLDELIHCYSDMEQLRDRVLHECAPAMVDNPIPAANIDPPPPQQLHPAGSARQVIQQKLSSWVTAQLGTGAAQPAAGAAQPGAGSGAILVLRTTPGAGKTHAMLREAYSRYLAGKQVVYATRTKEPILPPDGELYQRLQASAWGGKLRLAVLTGRDENNCHRIDAVRLASAHGYPAAHAVCRKCEHHPDNYKSFGFRMCDYYESRAVAETQVRAARKGWNKQYPFVLTTQALVATSAQSGGGRLGSALASPDLIFMDEDPTDAFESDVILTEAQCAFKSTLPSTAKAGLLAQLLAETILLAKEARRDAAKSSFRLTGVRKQGEKRPEGQGIHTERETYYVSSDLHCLLQEAAKRLARRLGSFPPVESLLRDIETGEGFAVEPGQLLNARDISDIHREGVPPRAMQLIAEGAHREVREYFKFRRETLQLIHPKLNLAIGEDMARLLVEGTDIGDCSYAVRLECQPADPKKHRANDEWAFVYRRLDPFHNHESPIVIGDAYAEKAHYEYLFGRSVDVEQVAVQLNNDALFVRVAYPHASIGALREGELQSVFEIAESALADAAKPRDRLLVYGHQELRPKVEAWLEDMRARFGLADCAYEHWWGGRGKDQYNGWEFTVCISNPTLHIGAIQHVANARQFAAFCSTTSAGLTPQQYHDARDTRIGREFLGGDPKRGTAHVLRHSTPGIWREHLRMGVGELTQAIHRSRPVHNPTRILIIGETELDAEVLAQTDALVLPDARQVQAPAPGKRTPRDTSKPARIEGSYSSLVSEGEVYTAIRAILCHFGVYCSWFAHALAQPPVDPEKAQWFWTLCNGLLLINNTPLHKVPGASNVHASAQVLGTDPLADDTPRAGGPTPGASLIRRAWDPTPRWELALSSYHAPRAIVGVHNELFRSVCVQPEAKPYLDLAHPVTMELPWPPWAKRPGWTHGRRRPKVLFDAGTMDGTSARRIAEGILATQYGPVQDGQIVRPDFDPVLPTSLGAIPF
jgi:hypothetical protein